MLCPMAEICGNLLMLEVLMRQHFEARLEEDKHTDSCYANENPFTTTEKFTYHIYYHLLAHKKLCSPQYDPLRWKVFEIVGCLITSGG